MAAWAVVLINGSLAAAGTIMPALTPEKKEALMAAMKNEGVLYHGLEVLGGGSILGGLIMASIAVFIIDRVFYKAAAFAAVGAVMTFFGFMHGERIGFAQSPLMAVSYLMVAAVLFGCAKFAVVEPKPAEENEHEALPEPAH
jgi:AGZA family xanthine/uracil permease-like MFS transporter